MPLNATGKRSFTEYEYGKLANTLRDIARRLNQYADEINATTMED